MDTAKIDLHLHLDGSLSPQMIIELAQKDDVVLPTYDAKLLKKYLSVSRNCSDLNEYLQCFEIPLLVLQTEDSLQRAAYDLVNRLEEQGIFYAEIRFAPQLHTRMGLTQTRVVEAVIDGMQKASVNGTIKTQAILCCMRGDAIEKENLETIRVAKTYLGKGVAAVDLAGAEALYPTSDYECVFRKAHEMGIPITIHAGEAAGAKSVKRAIEYGARRIGHGVRAFEDIEVLQELKKREIALEMCPTSNLQTRAIEKIEDYPLRKYLEYGLCVTINSDNMTVSDTTVEQEFSLLRTEYNLTEKEADVLQQNAIKAAFLSEEEKEELRCRMNKKGRNNERK